jgi:hypothetical protein
MLGRSANCSDLKSKNSFGKCFNRCLSTRCIIVKYYPGERPLFFHLKNLVKSYGFSNTAIITKEVY